jgi:UDP-N-acetylmuramate--alanine ligase
MKNIVDCLGESKKIYFIGIGGVGMSALAHIMHARGYCVSGSDQVKSKYTELLDSSGCSFEIEHLVADISADLVIISSAIAHTNPLLQKALSKNIPVYHRSELLGYIMNSSLSFGVTGTHGKTTTSSLLAFAAHQTGLDPSCIIGGTMHNFGTNALFGRDDIVIAEVDESDKSLLNIVPSVAVLTNIDTDHLDVYSGIDDIIATISQYVDHIQPSGCVVYNADDDYLPAIISGVKTKTISFGIERPATVIARNIVSIGSHTVFELWIEGLFVDTVRSALCGKHNVYNVLAALSALLAIGVNPKQSAACFASFKGVRRRLDLLFQDESLTIMDDYAHHPTEIRAVLSVLRTLKRPGESLCVVFQPHRYSRTAQLFDDFVKTFEDIDLLIITDIYAAGEMPIEGLSAKRLSDCICRLDTVPVQYVPESQLHEFLLTTRPDKALIAFLGAGNISEIAHEFSVEFKNTAVGK